MATNNLFKSDLYSLHGIIQNSMVVYPKEIIIATLRDFFSHDTYYHYSKDPWGFANTVDHTDLPLDAGLHDNITTRVFIGENYRFNSIFYPAILVKHGGTQYVPVSINRETTKVQWQERLFIDGYGNSKVIRTPQFFVFNGAWEGSVIVDVQTRSLRSRDDLAELVGICLTQIAFESLRRAGVIVKPISVSATSETDDRNDKLFRLSITLPIRSEWEVHVPISNIVEVISFTMEFGQINNPRAPIAQNLTIKTENTVLDIMASI